MGCELLVVDDDPEWRELLSFLFKQDGHRVQSAATARDCLKQLSKTCDLVLLDIKLPDACGFELCETIREQRGYETPMIALMSSTVHELQEGYEVGADDYVVKNGSPEDIRAKVNCILRRHARDTGILKRGELELDPKTQSLRIGHRFLSPTNGSIHKDHHLTPTEFRLLYSLVEANGQPVSLKRLSEEAFPGPSVGASRKVEVAVSRLRSKLPRQAAEKIQAIRNLGYIFHAAC